MALFHAPHAFERLPRAQGIPAAIFVRSLLGRCHIGRAGAAVAKMLHNSVQTLLSGALSMQFSVCTLTDLALTLLRQAGKQLDIKCSSKRVLLVSRLRLEHHRWPASLACSLSLSPGEGILSEPNYPESGYATFADTIR